MHPWGRKQDYDFRLTVMDRAMEAGFEDVGIGPLLGLYDHRFESLATIAHSMHLHEKFGSHAHTISVPRLRPSPSAALSSVPYPITDEEFKKIVAVFRLAVPSAGVVVSTRESAGLRTELLHIGASQLSAASRTDPGGYTHKVQETLEQFTTDDHRTLPEVMSSIVAEGYVPSLCTTCYRTGRTGHDFHEKTMDGDMGKLCQANAILTLKEYVTEHSGNGLKTNDDLQALFEEAIKNSMEEIKDPEMKKAVAEKLKKIEEGERDLFF
jgi:2-iminoacetate synthase